MIRADAVSLLPRPWTFLGTAYRRTVHRLRVAQGWRNMPKATWNQQTIAQSDACIEVEGNQYFPESAVDSAFLVSSDHTSFCGWKGTANYYHVEVDGKRNENAAWYYAEPYEAAEMVRGRIAFWKGVEVEK